MSAITVEIGGVAYQDALAGMVALTNDIDDAFEQGFKRAPPELMKSFDKVTKEMTRLHGRQWNGNTVNSGRGLQRRSGEGLRSLIESVKVSAGRGEIIAVGEIGGGKLSFHEEGGTIRATRSQYLTIPLPAALDPRGVPLRRRARDWDNTFVKRSRRGNLIIFRKLPGPNELTPLYVLKTQVYIPPRLRLGETLMGELGYFSEQLLEELSNVIDEVL